MELVSMVSAALLGVTVWVATGIVALTLNATDVTVAIIAAAASIFNTYLLKKARDTQKEIKRSTKDLEPVTDRLANTCSSLARLADEREHHIVSMRRLVHRMENALDIAPPDPDEGRRINR